MVLASQQQNRNNRGLSPNISPRILPVSLIDLHIAAHARSNGLTLVTNNLREFERVPGLLLENWIDGQQQ